MVGLFLISTAMFLTVYVAWLVIRSQATVSGWPIIGGALGNLLSAIEQNVLDDARAVIGVVVPILVWSLQRIHDAVAVIAHEGAVVVGTVAAAVDQRVAALEHLLQSTVLPDLAALKAAAFGAVGSLAADVVTSVTGAVALIANLVTAAGIIAGTTLPLLTAILERLTGRVIPALSGRVAGVEQAVGATVLPELRGLESQVGAFERRVAETLSRPATGLLDRVGGLEGQMSTVLPIAGVLAVSAAATVNLGRLARDPCWCTTSGPLRDQSWLQLAALMDLL